MNLTLFLNHSCNLRCTYCYTGRKFHRPMSLSVMERAVELGLDLADHRFLMLTFFGGEPLMEPDLMEATVLHARARGEARGIRVFPGVATNGTLLDRGRLEMLKRHEFQVQLSLDGCPAAQDATRRFRNGRSSAARVEQNLRTLLDEGFNPRVLSVIDPDNVDQLGPSFDYFMALGVKKIHYSPNYSGAWDEVSCARFEEALADLGSRYMDRLRQDQDVRLDPLNGKVVTHLNRGYKPGQRCMFGVKELTVAPSGRIYPCDRLVAQDDDPAVCIGHVDSGIDVARRDALVANKDTPDDECAACELQPRCMFWCGCANYETTGDVGQVAPITCWFERCFIAEADRVASTLYTEKCPAFLKRFYAPDAVFETKSSQQES